MKISEAEWLKLWEKVPATEREVLMELYRAAFVAGLRGDHE